MPPVFESLCEKFRIKRLYHMTHIRNLPSILQHGLLSHNKAHAGGIVQQDISLAEVQSRRAAKRLGTEGRALHDYACLYFNPSNPMLFCRRDQRSSIILLAFERDLLCAPGTVFTDGNAASHGTHFLSRIEDLSLLDWEAIRAEYWAPAREERRRRCAEVLVPDIVPVEYLQGVYCDTRQTAEAVFGVRPKGAPWQVIHSPRRFFQSRG